MNHKTYLFLKYKCRSCWTFQLQINENLLFTNALSLSLQSLGWIASYLLVIFYHLSQFFILKTKWNQKPSHHLMIQHQLVGYRKRDHQANRTTLGLFDCAFCTSKSISKVWNLASWMVNPALLIVLGNSLQFLTRFTWRVHLIFCMFDSSW